MEKMSIRLNIIDREGKETAIDIEEDTTIRDAIVNKLSPANYGNCGGDCICGSCQVHVALSDFEKLRVAEEDEIETLKTMAIKPIANSRLGCQIKLNKEYNNITVTIAPD